MPYSNDYYEFEAYSHSGAPTAPLGNETAHIMGVELEIGNMCDYYALNDLTDSGYIEAYDSASAAVVIEEEAQSGVEFELIFRADTHDNLMARINHISSELSGAVDCHRATSCHVHLNRYFIEDVLGLDEMDIMRAAEAAAPFIYAISGRSLSSWTDWTPSALDVTRDYVARFDDIDGARCHSGRYNLCNLTNDNTIEIRGFSNYYEFNAGLIGVYLDVVGELLPNIAQAMRGKDYASNRAIPIRLIAEFISEHSDELDGFNVEPYANADAILAKAQAAAFACAIDKYEDAQRYLDAADNIKRTDARRAARYLLDLLDKDSELTLAAIHLDNIGADIADLRAQAAKLFKNRVWHA